MILDRCVTKGLQANTLFFQKSLKYLHDQHDGRKAILRELLRDPHILDHPEFCNSLERLCRAAAVDSSSLYSLKTYFNNDQQEITLSRRAILLSTVNRLAGELDNFMVSIAQLLSEQRAMGELALAFTALSL